MHAAPDVSPSEYNSPACQVKKLVNKAKARQRSVAAAAASGGATSNGQTHDVGSPLGRVLDPADVAVPGHVKRKLRKKAEFLESASSQSEHVLVLSMT